jgi:hypothetical protein
MINRKSKWIYTRDDGTGVDLSAAADAPEPGTMALLPLL